ncbi:MAG: hypothetical protein WCI89_01370 [bacterium]
MNPKSIADIPIAIISVVFIAGITGVVSINPFLILLGWVLVAMSSVFLMFANVINGGYKNDWHRNQGTGDKWREGLIAIGLLFGMIATFMAQILWESTGSTDMRLLVGIIIIGIIFSYLNIKFRYKVFEQLTPEEKESPIKISDLGKYIRWYVWLIFLLYVIELLPFIFPLKK